MLSVAAVVVAASAVMAEPQFEAAIEQMKVLEPLVGDWFWDEWTAPKDYPELGIEEGDKLKRVRSYKLDLLDSILVGEIRLEDTAGKRILVAKSLSGWDAVSGKIVGMSFWAGPFGTWYAGKLEWSAKGNTLTLKATGSQNKDKSTIERDLVFESEDVLIVKTRLNTVNGQPVEGGGQTRLERIK
jgi:hypothetical protein